MTPQRVRLSRRPGWRLPENTVVVARPTVFGNPFSVTTKFPAGTRVGGGANYIAVPTAEEAVEHYRAMLMLPEAAEPGTRLAAIRAALPTLRGKHLACWCRPGQPCHADVLLEFANR